MKNIVRATAVAAAMLVAAGDAAAAIEWNVSLWGKRRAFTEHVEKLAELLEQKSGGEFTLNLAYGGTLSKNRENLDGISIGAFEMAQFCAGYHPGKNRTLTVLELPFLGVDTLEQDVEVSRVIYSHPAVVEEMAGWNAKLLLPSPMSQYNIVGTGEPRDSVEKFKGMRVRAAGGVGRAFAEAGAVPTSMAAPEVYNAMESGVVDTVAFAQHAHLSFRTIDLATWWTENLNPGTIACPIVANIDSYNSLPADLRKILDESLDESLEHYLENYYANVIEKWDHILVEKNVRKVRIEPAQVKAFRQSSTSITNDWIKSMEEQGHPGQELYDLVQNTLNN